MMATLRGVRSLEVEVEACRTRSDLVDAIRLGPAIDPPIWVARVLDIRDILPRTIVVEAEYSALWGRQRCLLKEQRRHKAKQKVESLTLADPRPVKRSLSNLSA